VTGRLSAAVSALCVAAGVAVGAADVWESKPYNTWSDAELKEVMTNSPWAGKGIISYIKTNGANSPTIDDAALVSWVSGLPMRQASVREQIKAGTEIPADIAAALAKPLDMYTVAVKISGTDASSSWARSASAMQAETFLLREGKAPIAAAQSEGRTLDKDGKVVPTPTGAPGGGFGAPRGGGTPGAPGGGGAPANAPALSVGQGGGGFGGGGGGFGGGGGGGGRGGIKGGSSLLIYAFPKSDAITLADKEVEFVSKLCGPSFGRGGPASPCQYNIKKKFKIKDMVLKGEPAL
jgi:hypothetical protein